MRPLAKIFSLILLVLSVSIQASNLTPAQNDLKLQADSLHALGINFLKAGKIEVQTQAGSSCDRK